MNYAAKRKAILQLLQKETQGPQGLVYGSVCSGIEAATAAWHPLGWEASFLSEIEPFPRAVLAHHYPDTPLHADFTTIQHGQYRPIDLLVGGTPCQAFSVAGLRGGLGDERGNLALEYCRLAGRLKPRWLVWENVPGVLSSNGGRDFGSLLWALADLGYGVAYRVLDAQFFGLAQRRKRVFLVGYLGDWRPAAAVLFEPQSLSGNFAPSHKTGHEAAQLIGASLAGSGGDLSVANDAQGKHPRVLAPHLSLCLNAGSAGRLDPTFETFVVHTFGKNTSPAARRLTPTEYERLQGFPDGFTAIPWRGKPAEGCPDGPRYKALGNSMAVPVMAWLGRRIQLAAMPTSP